MFASIHQHKSHSRYQSGRNTPRSGTATPGRRPFQEDPNKAVFVTGLQKVEGSEYDIYRNKCYSDLQMSMGNGGRIYVAKFDFPQLADHAFVHVRTERMAQYLLTKKTITLAGEKCKVYNYNREKESIDADDVVINIEEAPLKSVTMNPLMGIDSCYETRLASPAAGSRSLSRMSHQENDSQAHAGEVAAPPVTRQPSTVDNVLHKDGLDVLQQKLEQISSSQSTPTVTEDWSTMEATPLEAPVMLQAPVVAQQTVAPQTIHSIVDQISIPEVFDLNTYANLKCQGAQIVSQGLMTVAEFNDSFALIFNNKLRAIVGTTLTENLAVDAANNLMQNNTGTMRVVAPIENVAVAY